VAVEAAGRTVVAVSHHRIAEKPGSDIELAVSAQDLHFFNSESGEAIAHGDLLA
jgi:multiple sugar transport system ATP-binding protein